jgi:hypothetical protein
MKWIGNESSLHSPGNLQPKPSFKMAVLWDLTTKIATWSSESHISRNVAFCFLLYLTILFRLPRSGNVYFHFVSYIWTSFRSQWPRCLRHEQSSSTWTLGSWVRIALEAWISVYVYSVCDVLCEGSGLATDWSPVQGVLPTVRRIRKLKSGQGSTKDCRAIDWWMDGWMDGWMDRWVDR